MFEILNISSNDAVIDDQKLLPPLHLSFINEPQNELILKSIFHKSFLVVKMKMYVKFIFLIILNPSERDSCSDLSEVVLWQRNISLHSTLSRAVAGISYAGSTPH